MTWDAIAAFMPVTHSARPTREAAQRLTAIARAALPADGPKEDTWEKEQVPSGKTSRFLHVDKRQDRFKRPWRARYSDNEGRRRNKGFETELEAARFADRKRVELWEAQSDQRRLPRTNFDYRGYLKGGDAAAGAPTKQGHGGGTETQHSSGSQGDG